MKKYALAAMLILSAIAFAQTSDKIILVSDTTSVDMLVAKAAGEKSGIPVLVLENGMLDDETRNQMTSLGVKTVYLVGGPAVIKTETETELSAKYTVVRLWGYERTGTSIAVFKHFWAEGSECAVIADDTKDSAADTEVQAEASEEASNKGCPFIPVPKGTMPAEVLEVFGELNVTNATFVGKVPSGEFRAKLAKIRTNEIIGDIASIEASVEAGNKLLIIAAPNWKDVLGHAGHSGHRTIVRITNSTASVPRLVELVNSRNITDVRVLGEPTLAGEIATQLNASGINVTKVSGSHSQAARDGINRTIEHWEEKRREAAQLEARLRAKAREKLTERLTKFQDRLNALESELAERNTSEADAGKVNSLQARIDAARRQVSAIKDLIDSSNIDTARIRLDKTLGELESARWAERSTLKISSDEVAREEGSIEKTRAADIASISQRLDEIEEKCNSDAVSQLVEKARSLKDEADAASAAGDEIKAARLSVAVRELVAQAHNIRSVCERGQAIDQRLETGVRQVATNAEAIKARIVQRVPIAVRPTDAAP